MPRVIITLLDSFGIGYAHDAELFGDKGADTLGHIAKWMAENRRDGSGNPVYLTLPHLASLGLERAHLLSAGSELAHTLGDVALKGAYTCASEVSRGKDTLSGHWEIAGVPVEFDWGYFDDVPHCFPAELVEKIIERGKIPGVLGECHASGTEIIKRLGAEHVKSGKPIIYTSADSVLQIACHEESFGLERLYELCRICYELVKPYHIARVIARPFVGDEARGFERVGAHRHDYAVPAVDTTLLDRVTEAGGNVYAVGKIADIFAQRGVTKHYPAAGLDKIMDATLRAVKEAPDRTLVFSNFVNFDSDFGHRRDPQGYGEGLEYVDGRLPELFELLGEDDVLLVTADHGCDPTWRGSDHTREKIPVLFYGAKVLPHELPPRKTFSDLGQTIASLLGTKTLHKGETLDLFGEKGQ